MKDMNDGTKHRASPKGDLYAVVSKKGKKDNPAYNGGVDNDNFVTESDGAYDPVKVESPKSSPEPAKKVTDYSEADEDVFVLYDYSTLLGTSHSSGSYSPSLDFFTVITRVWVLKTRL